MVFEIQGQQKYNMLFPEENNFLFVFILLKPLRLDHSFSLISECKHIFQIGSTDSYVNLI